MFFEYVTTYCTDAFMQICIDKYGCIGRMKQFSESTLLLRPDRGHIPAVRGRARILAESIARSG